MTNTMVTEKMVEAALAAVEMPIRGPNGIRKALEAALSEGVVGHQHYNAVSLDREIKAAALEQEQEAVGVKTSRATFKEAAVDLVRKNGWVPGNNLSLHSAVELMTAFGMMVDRGEIGCDWPQCGCCADAACADALTVISNYAGRISAAESEVVKLRAALEQIREDDWSEYQTSAGPFKVPGKGAMIAITELDRARAALGDPENEVQHDETD